MLTAMCILFLWGHFRKNRAVAAAISTERKADYQRIRRISRVFWLVFLVFSVMVFIYVVFPHLYYVFLPMDMFHHPVINSIGLLTIKVAIAWIVVAQLHIDKELFKYLNNIESMPAMKLVWYSEGMLIAGMLVLFVGIVITITNVVGLALAASSVVFFYTSRVYRYD